MSGHHDVGGRITDEAIPRGQHAFMPWELRVDALMWLLTDPSRAGGRLMTVDELRRGIEAMPADDYAKLGYYEKWLTSLVAIMAENGIIDRTELANRVEAVTQAVEHEHALEHRGER
jgi:hypothetical protein